MNHDLLLSTILRHLVIQAKVSSAQARELLLQGRADGPGSFHFQHFSTMRARRSALMAAARTVKRSFRDLR